VCAPEHPLARARRLRPAALASERWLVFPPRPGGAHEPYAERLSRWLALSGAGRAETVAVDSLTAQKRMVEAGFGLALLPASSVDEELRAGTLRVLRAPGVEVTLPVVLIQRKRAYLSGAARALIDVLGSPRWR
jgi:DNA-binding transcriptional LysR family regulator